MFDTPQEAALKAEVARLRGENEWLRRAVEAPSRIVRPWGVEEELISSAALPPDYRLPRVADVRGRLLDDGRLSVVATQERMDREKSLSVAYYSDGYHRKHIDDMTFVNHVLPKMHERFIRVLADIYTKQYAR